MLPPHLVTLGLPFYGRHVKTGDWKSYEDLVQMHAPLEPDVDEAGGYYFNGPHLIQRKTRLAIELGLGGVMIWEVGQDCRQHAVAHGETTHVVTCPQGERSALLAAIGSELSDGREVGAARALGTAPVEPGGGSAPRDEL